MLTPRFYEALSFAAQLHRKQTRKGSGVPYISHLLAVTSIVLDYGATEDEAIAALLHDAIEDQGGAATREVIYQRFGENVGAIVDGCSDTDQTPKPPWQQRKDAYLEHLQTASNSVRLVSAADKLHNVRSTLQLYRQFGQAAWDVFKGKKEGTLWYYRSVVDMLRSFNYAPHTPLVEELDRAVQELESAAALSGNPLA